MMQPPSQDVAAWHTDCLTALRLQQRRLPRAATARTATQLEHPARDRFRPVVQASDIVPLIDVMDDQGQALIRELPAPPA